MAFTKTKPNEFDTKSVVTEYSPDEVKKLFAKELGVDQSEIDLNFVINDTSPDRPGHSPSYKVTAIKVRTEPSNKFDI